MSNEPFGRQPKPVTVRIEGGEAQDVEFWALHLARAAQYKGDNVQKSIVREGCAFTIYPRAVND